MNEVRNNVVTLRLGTETRPMLTHIGTVMETLRCIADTSHHLEDGGYRFEEAAVTFSNGNRRINLFIN